MVSLPEHGHCVNCDDPISSKEYFCSDDCTNEYAADVKEAKRLDRRFYALMAVSIAAIAAITYLFKFFIL
ncbi:MAG: DUF2116 family Zn-ribbon domain-containing protein [Methanomassiliicoccaceae archaeon]|nr:DUF2116 family Zn-ribbon domain-containing protein [Methanomassiliicoccaceae archaeon]